MIDPPLSLRYIHSIFLPLVRVRGLLTVPLALQSCQAIKEESAAASCTADLTRVCGQQRQPPSPAVMEISRVQKHFSTSCSAWAGEDHGVCAQLIPVSPGRAGSTEPPWRGCQGRQLASSFAASLRAGLLVGFTYGKWFCRPGLYLASFCLCSVKSSEQDKFIVSFLPVWHLAANARQIPQPECSSCLTMGYISSWSSL